MVVVVVVVIWAPEVLPALRKSWVDVLLEVKGCEAGCKSAFFCGGCHKSHAHWSYTEKLQHQYGNLTTTASHGICSGVVQTPTFPFEYENVEVVLVLLRGDSSHILASCCNRSSVRSDTFRVEVGQNWFSDGPRKRHFQALNLILGFDTLDSMSMSFLRHCSNSY